jgi:hypothetical protein
MDARERRRSLVTEHAEPQVWMAISASGNPVLRMRFPPASGHSRSVQPTCTMLDADDLPVIVRYLILP